MFREIERKARGQEGQSMGAGIACILVVLVCCAFAVDLAFAGLERSRQIDLLNDAETKVMDPSYAIQVKNSAAPGNTACAQLVECLRDSGFDGEIEAYFYELPIADDAADESRRLYVFGAKITASTPTIFARLSGVEIASVTTCSWSWASPYSSGKTFKPANASNGILRVAANQANGTWTAVASPDESIMPGVTDAIKKAKSETSRTN